MKRNHTINRVLVAAAAAALSIIGFTQPASAVPINGSYIEDPRGDTLPSQSLTHELGEVVFFPQNEAFQVQFSPATFTVCVPDDGLANDWIVQITNVSGQAWTNLFFVGNRNMSIGNADGTIIDNTDPQLTKTDAFRIDAVGINANLLGESILNDGIFAPGETWRFNVSNFISNTGVIPPPFFRTPGLFSGTAPLNAALPDSASILATPVPEPTTIGAVVVGAAALLLRRPGRR